MTSGEETGSAQSEAPCESCEKEARKLCGCILCCAKLDFPASYGPNLVAAALHEYHRRNEQAEKALEWYGDEDNHKPKCEHGSRVLLYATSLVQFDRGQRARDALALQGRPT